MSWRSYRPAACALSILVATGAAQTPLATTDPATLAAAVSPVSGLTLAGTPAFVNLTTLSLSSSTAYDANALGLAAGAGDWSESFGAALTAEQQHGNWNWALDYHPGFIAYRRFTAYDELNQAGDLQLSARLAPTLFLRVAESARYGRFLLAPAAAAGAPPGVGLAGGIATPLAPEFSQQPQAELVFVPNYRTSLTVFGDYLERRFGADAAASLSNLAGPEAGVALAYRLSRQTTVGIQDDLARLRFTPTSAMAANTALLTLTHVFTARTRIDLSGGPEPVALEESFSAAALGAGGPISARGHLVVWDGGATFTHEALDTAWQFGLRRQVSDSGGLFAGAMLASGATVGGERRLARTWRARAEIGYSRLTTLGLPAVAGRSLSGEIRGAVADAELAHRLNAALRLRLDYDYLHQTNGGAILLPPLAHNRISLGLDYVVAGRTPQ